MKYQIRQLGLGGILDQSISLLRDHFGQLFGIVALTIVPFFAILGLVKASIIVPGDLQSLQIAQIVEGIGAMIFGLVLGPLVNAAVIYSVASAYLSRPTTIGECFGHGMKRFWAVLGTSMLMGLAIFGGMILCIVPGIIFAFWFMLAQHVAVLEGIAGSAALDRSKRLMKGNILTAFVLGLVLLPINMGLALGAAVIPQLHVQALVTAMVQGIATLLGTCCLVVFYFSCRCKFENFDLQVLADAVGTGADAPPAE